MSDKPNTSRWTLTQYLEEIFIPKKMAAGHLQKNTANRYRFAVRLFVRIMGADHKLRVIDEQMLERFAALLVKDGYKQTSARFYRTNVGIILRHWSPERFPNGQGNYQPGVAPFIESDIQGTLEQIFCDSYLPERTSISSPSTIRQYGRCLRLFTTFLGHPCTPGDLSDRVLGKFLRWMVEVGGVKPVTANGYAERILAMWVWLAKKRVVEQFPTIQKLKESELTPVAWTREEFQKLFAACGEQVGYIGPTLANLFWTAFYLVLWDTGERTGAMLALRWDWIDRKSGHLTVPGEFRKGRQQSMVYKLKPVTMRALKAIAKPDCELIFGMGVRKRPTEYFYRHHRMLVKSADVPFESRKSGPQKTRRTFASFIEAAGGNATKALKHRDRRVTEDSYLDPRITEVESENLKLFPLDDDTDAA